MNPDPNAFSLTISVVDAVEGDVDNRSPHPLLAVGTGSLRIAHGGDAFDLPEVCLAHFFQGFFASVLACLLFGGRQGMYIHPSAEMMDLEIIGTDLRISMAPQPKGFDWKTDFLSAMRAVGRGYLDLITALEASPEHARAMQIVDASGLPRRPPFLY